MKKLFFGLVLLAVSICPALLFSFDELPKPLGVVSDYANVLDDNTKQQLTALINEVGQKTSAEIAVVTIKDLGGESVEGYARRLFDDWKPGKKGKDNGVLFLTAVNDHKVRIEVGYGLEGIIPDGKAGSLMDDCVVPCYKQGDYNKGVMMGAIAIAQVIAEDAKVTLDGKYNQSLKKNDDDVIARVVLMLVFFIVIPILSWRGRRRGGRGGPGGFIGGGGFGGGGFGGGGGGFGGFGGGFGGGGGSSRGW